MRVLPIKTGKADARSEHGKQARRYAQYYVFLNRGYDTVTPKWKNPVHLQAVRSAIDSMDLEVRGPLR